MNRTPFNYRRRHTVSVNVGGVPLGSDWPVRVQSMTNTDTNDIERSAEQCQRIAQAGADYVRLTAQGVREAEGIGMVRNLLRKQGCNVPLVADIHFNPRAALAAAALCDKVRINPGNFVDPARTFSQLTYTDDEYQTELLKISEALLPFIQICREHGTAVRLGVNHGSLSDRIMSRYGNTPAGMVESAMEFLRVFVAEGFMDVVISMKSSNVQVMIEAVRRMVAAMEAEHMSFPLHLGVTEAGFGEDGRIKSAVGIGTLLGEGLGDTIRVSLSEDPELEVPVAQKLVEYIATRDHHPAIEGGYCKGYDPLSPPRRPTRRLAGKTTPVVIGEANTVNAGAAEATASTAQLQPDFTPDHLSDLGGQCLVIIPDNVNIPGSLLQQLHELENSGNHLPIIARVHYDETDLEWLQVKAGADLGPVALSGLVDGIWIDAPAYPRQDDVLRIALAILQAARLRITKTEFISCPSCGRTLFDLQDTVRRVQQATAHLTHLKIGVMGCIVNGPGEMADADYGYVGAAPGRISLYKNKECIEKNIPTAEAIDRLVALIKANGDWREP
ncbi:MAG: (E)-4-hydroxy-3-methylbut-2-enyl-diphosphate synthase [Muribaculaceae bacterium]|nr:(E)-4-hydroxy-3-methylbut-2-enyl-diphosphate synthase [Muribaculaceae bacterium]